MASQQNCTSRKRISNSILPLNVKYMEVDLEFVSDLDSGEYDGVVKRKSAKGVEKSKGGAGFRMDRKSFRA